MKTTFAIALALLASPAAAQTTRHVPADHPNIALAISASANGDIIEVAPGTYTGYQGSFIGKAVTVRSAEGPAVTILDGDDLAGTAFKFDNYETNASVIQGFTFRNYYAPVLHVTRGSPTIIDNVFEDNGSTAFGTPWSVIHTRDSFAVIERNVFRRNSCDEQFATGVVMLTNGGAARIANNVFDDNDCHAIGVVVPENSPQVIVNNTMVRNRGGIFVAGQAPPHAQVYRNNLIYQNGVGLEVDDYGHPVTWESNLVFGNDEDYDYVSQTGMNGNVSVDPRLDRLSVSEYCLDAASGAIDVGDANGVDPGEQDLYGAPRVLDGNADATAVVDIGAVEYAGAACVTPPPEEDDGGGGGPMPAQSFLILLGAALARSRRT
jgi:serine protease